MKKKRIYLVLLAMVVTLAGVSYYYWYQNAHYVSTEDARIDGNVVKVSPQVSGQIIELPIEENQDVDAGEYMGRLSDVTLSSGANLDLTVIKAPISGTVIKKIAHIGEVASPGVAVAMIADLKDLYVTANIEESDLNKLKVGQTVHYTIDTFPGEKFQGKILSVGNAANSVFSLLPQQSTSNSFTKVTQRIPVKISIEDYHNKRLLPGMNAIVKINIK
ncbi:HlyD family secretion protein [Desulforamulus aeronauticus]|uniref:Barrel-sandwich domain of CusB or HlyD membrane-fusion n=1 Tax=Desulforamulus aeronauticus DSM 10349 TaxID=1121421 RepID=A0A1M6QQ39_9FIRM|nr:efflux RND transporter periplasmic adaptor subunit [Desulforamulus aeronauticus]SHK22402.1 Barrel-sandwich domain of CusB or HlyD membrane-fusion [Desulforamulus aeronauticus DSM 10349]